MPPPPTTKGVESPAVLCVDLDGTLVATDTLGEMLSRLAAQHPARLVLLPLWFLLGKAGLKARLAQAASLDPARLPYRPEVISYLRQERARGRTVFLTTAAPRAIAEPIAAHLALFDDVLATDGAVNRRGVAKLAAIRERIGADQFDYVGDSGADLPVWRGSRRALLVNPPASVQRRVERLGVPWEILVPRRIGPVAALAREVRTRAWIRDLLVSVPILAAAPLDTPDTWKALGLGVVSFGAVSSLVALVASVLDLSRTADLPGRSGSPLAVGDLPLGLATRAAAGLLIFAVLLSLALPRTFGLWLVATAVLGLLQVLALGRIAILGTLARAVDPVLRLGAGAAAVGLSLSVPAAAAAGASFLVLARFLRATASTALLFGVASVGSLLIWGIR